MAGPGPGHREDPLGSDSGLSLLSATPGHRGGRRRGGRRSEADAPLVTVTCDGEPVRYPPVACLRHSQDKHRLHSISQHLHLSPLADLQADGGGGGLGKYEFLGLSYLDLTEATTLRLSDTQICELRRGTRIGLLHQVGGGVLTGRPGHEHNSDMESESNFISRSTTDSATLQEWHENDNARNSSIARPRTTSWDQKVEEGFHQCVCWGPGSWDRASPWTAAFSKQDLDSKHISVESRANKAQDYLQGHGDLFRSAPELTDRLLAPSKVSPHLLATFALRT
eukprot:750461-Hanusia_phi.AAC.1